MRLRHVIKRIRSSDWKGYLSKLSGLKLDREIKEYFFYVLDSILNKIEILVHNQTR
jgi:hypothetical protein